MKQHPSCFTQLAEHISKYKTNKLWQDSFQAKLSQPHVDVVVFWKLIF